MRKDIRKLTNEGRDNLLDASLQALEMICDIGCDYDGEYSIDGLKKVIDELVEFAKDGLDGKRPQYIGQGKVFEIVFSEDVEVPKERWHEDLKNYPWL